MYFDTQDFDAPTPYYYFSEIYSLLLWSKTKVNMYNNLEVYPVKISSTDSAACVTCFQFVILKAGSPSGANVKWIARERLHLYCVNHFVIEQKT